MTQDHQATLESVLTTAAQDRTRLRHYGSSETDLEDHFAGRNVVVEHRRLPDDGPDPFVVVLDADGFVGALSESDLDTLLEPTTDAPWLLNPAEADSQIIYELLDDTVFGALDRRQLLGTAREIENRAWRVGAGRLHVGFQTRAAFTAQATLYDRLSADTDLDVHVYVADAEPAADCPALTVHVESTPEVGQYWFMAFDGGPEPSQACALVARQLDTDSYEGVWTYDPTLVDRVFAAVEGS